MYVSPSSTENESLSTVITGAMVSSVMSTGDDDADVFGPSVAVAVNEFSPSVSVTVNEKFPSPSAVIVSTVDPSLNSSTVVPASAAPSIVNDDKETVSDGVVIAGTGGVSVSSVMSTAGDAPDVFGPSDAVALNEFSPSVSVTVNEKDPESAATVSPVDVAPLSSATVVPASAVPSIVIDGVSTVAGEVVIAGASGGMVSSVMTTGDDATRCV